MPSKAPSQIPAKTHSLPQKCLTSKGTLSLRYPSRRYEGDAKAKPLLLNIWSLGTA